MPQIESPARAARGSSVQKKGSKPIACQRCHSRKVRCSGGQPCLNCRNAGDAVSCTYPTRDRQIKLSEQYVEELLKENERLRNSAATGPAPAAATADDGVQDGYETVRNPLLEERPWFHPVSADKLPIQVGEAADSAFATRFRQTLGTGNTKHLLRMSFIGEEPIIALADSPLRWPTPSRAHFLVKVALSTVCQYYHVVRRSEVLKALEECTENNGHPLRNVRCKLLALFAIGEAYSARHAPADAAAFPGLAYFAHARRIVSIPDERAQLDTVETLLLLVHYCFVINRRHAAYIFASTACRQGLIMGLNMNVPENQYRDRLSREHRVRLWWTAYTIDRSCASKLGLPVSVVDDDIIVDLPSNAGLEAAKDGDFGDIDYSLNSIKLSTLAARLTRSIYSRRNHQEPFLKRVQAILKELTKWMDVLPAKFHFKDDEVSAPIHVVYIHLRFNQCCILATRPILLYVLRSHKHSWEDPSIDPKSTLPDGALILAETCIQCARHTYRILTQAWVNGTFATLDYYDTQYFFSATTILAISSLLGSSHSQQDGDDFKNAVELLSQLSQSGSYGAKEFTEQLQAIEESMQASLNMRAARSMPPPPLHAHTSSAPTLGSSMTAGMALADPSLQYFLSEADIDLQNLNNPTLDSLQTPYWPEMWGDGWGVGGDV